ncbi:MAG: hypothetical protein J7J09_06955 [Kosmotoga sp.]|nr:hypothetical protein [Kosmotoga sp.]
MLPAVSGLFDDCIATYEAAKEKAKQDSDFAESLINAIILTKCEFATSVKLLRRHEKS